MVGTSVLLCALMVAQDKPASKFPLGKETTYVDGPLDSEGYIDYETAINERLGKGITPDKNAVVLLWRAIGPRTPNGLRMPAEYFKWLGAPEPPDAGDYFIGLTTYLKDQLKEDPDKLSEFLTQQDKAVSHAWKAAGYPHIAGWIQANEKPLAVVIEASKRSEYFNPLVSRRTENGRESLLGAQLLGVARYRDMAYALAARATLKVGEGKCDEAWQDLLACHRLGRLAVRGGTLIETLAAVGIDRIAINGELAFLECPSLKAEQVRSCLKDLQGLPPLPHPGDKIDLMERFKHLDCAQFVRRGGINALDSFADRPVQKKTLDPAEEKVLAAIDWETLLRDINRWHDRMVTGLRITNRSEREKEFGPIERDLKLTKNNAEILTPAFKKLREGKDPGKEIGKGIGNSLVGLLSPNLRSVQYSFDRAEQTQRNLHLAFALAAYQRDNGRYPAKLDDLAPKYLTRIPDDLFSGKAIIYRSFETGYLLYSVGVNGRDNQGLGEDVEYSCDDLAVRGGDQEKDYVQRMKGTWVILSGSIEGKEITDDERKSRKIIFDDNRMTTKEGDIIKEVVTFKLNASKKPVWFDTTEEKKASLLGLMYLGPDSLFIYSLKSDDERPTEITSETGTKGIYLVLSRERK